MLDSVKNFFVEKRWALGAIFIGVLMGFLSAVICVRGNLVIFGFNIMFIVSPLIAGYVEAYVARRKYGRSTGAISALLIFILINAYSWLFPKDPIVLNLFTLGGLALMIQAAFPILINYILFVVFLGTITWVIGYLGNFLSNLTDKIVRRSPDEEVDETGTAPVTPGFLDSLESPILTIPYPSKGRIVKHLGMVVGESVVGEKESKGISKIISQDKLDGAELSEARERAIAKLLEEAEKIGGNTVIEVLIDYNSVGGLSGNATIVTATGTAVQYE
ncbi:MAG: heavy metal-binding domain-containing protein [Methanobacteriaceae archaeon]